MARAQQDHHEVVRPGLVRLSAVGTASADGHELLGVPGGVKAQATGFFVGNDGFILTTRHFLEPLEKAGAKQVKFTASRNNDGSNAFPLLIASELERVDLLLMKAKLPFDMEKPQPLRIGRTSSYDRSNPSPLFTSGFAGDTYRRKTADYNDSESGDFPYAWSLNLETDSGQSGSPVYDGDGTVLGVIKGTVDQASGLTLMIPIEFAMPLIGHMEIDRLNQQVTLLRKIIGKMTQDDPPLHDRLEEIEDNMTELGSRFDWNVETAPDGTLRIRYEKLIGGGVQVDGIFINIRPFLRFNDGDDTVSRAGSPLRLNPNQNFFERERLDDNARVGEFIIPEVHQKLETLASVLADVKLEEPFRSLDVTVVPSVDGTKLEPRKMSVVPDFEWNLTP
ncbi:S1 family peptidase [Thalassococcus sp. BH17M4-6]|uniref:S1 family peptidase n=1 Tax=Thalassococcus sp. BH17M4-6 TaxID=3413148 RepID=UPI003BF4671B